MDETEIITIKGFSGPMEELYSDILTLQRSGEIFYKCTMGSVTNNWMSSATSIGYQILFSVLSVELLSMNKNKKITDDKKGGYHIEITTKDGEEFSYTFYGTMEENEQESLRDALIDFFPVYTEFPKYMLVTPSDLSEEKLDFIEETVN